MFQLNEQPSTKGSEASLKSTLPWLLLEGEVLVEPTSRNYHLLLIVF